MKEKKNISILTIDYGAGGAERVISLLLKYLINDFNVTLVIFYNFVDYDIPKEVELKILLPSGNRNNTIYRKAKDTIMVANKYHRIIKNKKIDISLSFLALPNIINGIIKMRNKNIRTVISERCFPSIMYKENKSSEFLANYMFPFFYSKNDHLFSNSIYINDDLKSNFKVNMPMSVVYNPIELNDNYYKPIDSITSKEIFNIINVGTIYEIKNQKLIVDAMLLLKDSNYRLKLLGDGIMEDDLKAFTDKNGLSKRVKYMGRIGGVKDHLVESDCFVLSSNTEGFPNVLLEAMSVGLPVISTNCMSGPLELLNENVAISIEPGLFYKAKYGLLINTNDAKALALALKHFKETPKDRITYSQLGIQRAKDYELPIIYEQVKEILNG